VIPVPEIAGAVQIGTLAGLTPDNLARLGQQARVSMGTESA
jgi:hypothetical protein